MRLGKGEALFLVAALLAPAAAGCGGMSGGAAGGASALPTVVFLANGIEGSLSPEEAAAWAWLKGRPAINARYVQLVDLDSASWPADAVLWWHYAAQESLPAAAVRPASLDAVRRHVLGGGGVLLTLLAAPWVVPLRLEEAPPDTVTVASALAPGSELGGLQSRLGHPLLQRFWGGVLTSRGARHAPRAAALYTGGRWPRNGRVWAVYRDEREVDATVKVGVEYDAPVPGAGNVVTVGAGLYFADAANPQRVQLEQLVTDAIGYLSRRPPPPAGGRGAATPVANAGGRGDAGSRSGAQVTPAEGAAPPSVAPVADGERRYWGPIETDVAIAQIEPTSLPVAANPGIVLQRLLSPSAGPSSALALTRYPTAEAPFTLASPGVVAAGSQLGRIDELWVHPQRILRDLRFGIVRPGRGITWLDAGGGEHTFIARPAGAELNYRDGDVDLSLHVAVDRRRYPALVAVLVVRSPAALDVIASWEIDRSASWPRGGSLFGPLELGWDDGARAALWRARDGGFAAMAGFGRPTAAHLLGYRAARDLGETGLILPTPASPAEAADLALGDEVSAAAGIPTPAASTATAQGSALRADAVGGRGVAVQVHVEPAQPAVLPFVVVGGDATAFDVGDAFAELVSAPGRVWTDNAAYYDQLLDSRTGVRPPDTNLENDFRWAEIGLDALSARAAAVGSGLLAAAGAVAPAFGGAGSLWAVLAADSYGDRETAAATLRLAARYQGIDGRLPSAVSPSWLIDQGSAAATPLFVIAAEDHVRTWGDRALLDELWPAVVAALDYGAAADRNQDGLIDALSTADRWGAGPEVITPIDLAGLWGAALGAGARLAQWKGDPQRAEAARQGADRVRLTLNQEQGFWDPAARNFTFAKRADGTFVAARTALTAVPMVFRLLDPGIANAALDQLAGADLSADWGVGLVSAAPPADAAAAGGAPAATPAPTALADRVSPALTGWAALAELAYRRPAAGFGHAATNLQLIAQGNVGRSPAALSRARFELTGVSHDAAALALTILPVTRGLLGIRPDAMASPPTLEVDPQLPQDWSRVIVTTIRMGADELDITLRRNPGHTQFDVRQVRSSGQPLRLRLSAHVPQEVAVAPEPIVSGGTLEGAMVVEDSFDDRAATVSVLTSADTPLTTVTVNHGEFPRLAAPLSLPQPGQGSQGLRVIRSRYQGGVMRVEMEGLPGKSYELRLATPWPIRQVTGVPVTNLTEAEPGLATIEVVIPGSGTRYRRVNLEVSFER